MTAAAPARAAVAPAATTRVLQRLIMPLDRDLDVAKLYVEGRLMRGTPTPGFTDQLEITGRQSLTVPPGNRISLCTYFNAFPAGYWRRWSVIDDVVLRIRVRGDATVIVYRSSAKGNTQRVKSVAPPQESPPQDDSHADLREIEIALPLSPFIDGGWYWFDIVAGSRHAVLERAEWCAATERSGHGRATIGITTYNRPDFCVDQLRALRAATDALDVVDEILVIDQGTQRVADHADFADVSAALGDKLRVIGQANLGGSGGFARAMRETLEAARSDYVLLLDDDIVAEPEGILRAVTFADLARTPTIVGGHMFSLHARSVLHAYGEGVEKYRWFYRPAPHTRYGHDFAVESLRTTPWLHRRVDVDYNAWWMCLVPVDVIRKIGLALPLFIKWDDAEYGVRAGQAGFPTVSLPGAAVWHVPWHDKDDTLDWQAYYHARNRIVAALLHSPYERGGNLVKESLFITAKHALAMQYSTAELILWALEDVLSGPDHLHATLATRIGEIRSLRARFTDAKASGDLDDFPRPRRQKPPPKGKEAAVPTGRRALLRAALRGAVRQLRPMSEFARRHPQAVVPHVDQRWWLLTQFDSALVSSADGTKISWYQRDPARFRSVARRSAMLHARLYRRWPRLSREYQAALGELVSPDSWLGTFEAGPAAPAGPAGEPEQANQAGPPAS